MAVYIAFMFVVAVLGTEDSRTHRAGEMFDVIFAIESGDIGATKGASTCMAEQVQPAEIIRFAERVLIWGLFWNGKEFGSNNFTTVLRTVSNCTEVQVSALRTWHVKHSRWYVPPRARTN